MALDEVRTGKSVPDEGEGKTKLHARGYFWIGKQNNARVTP